MSGEEYAGIYPLIKEKTLGGFLENAPAQRCGSLNRELYPRLVSVLRCSQHNGLLHDEDLRGFWLDNIRYSTNDSILLDSIEALTDPDGARGYRLDIYGRIVRKEKSEQRENQFPFAIDVLAGRSDAGTDRIKSFIRIAGLPYSRDKEKRKG